jgi:protein arginine kinase activator
MLCEKCDNSEVLFHLAEISNDIQSELHFCMKCAKNLKINSKWQVNSFSSIKNNSLGGETAIACLNCGLTTEELIYDGRPGCPSCYKYFNSVFNSISENNNIKKFSGKKPVNYIEIFDFLDTPPALKNLNIELLDSKVKLEEELKKAISEERYEEAAILRDKIKEVIESE